MFFYRILTISLLLLFCAFSDVRAQDKIYDETTLEALRDLEAQINIEDYFDSETVEEIRRLKKGEEEQEAGVNVVKPSEEPADSFVIVEKDYVAGSSQARMAAAARAIDLGRYEAAREIYQGLLHDVPDDVYALIGYASALQHLGMEEKAIEAYEHALDVDPENVDAHINMLGLIGHSYPAVALQRLQALEAKTERFNAPLSGQIAFTQAQLGRYKDALESYAMISAHEPHNPQHLLNMAIVADKAGLSERATSYYEEALSVDTIYAGGRMLDRSSIFDRLAQLR